MYRRRPRLCVAFVLALIMVLFGTNRGHAAPFISQLQTGNLYGVVTDTARVAVPGVTVTLTGGGAPQVQVTNDAGQFRFLGLPPSSYTVTVELEGFATLTNSNIVINIGRNTQIALTLTDSSLVTDSGSLSAPAPAPLPPAPVLPLPPVSAPVQPPMPLTTVMNYRGGADTLPIRGPFLQSTPSFLVVGRLEVCWQVTGQSFRSNPETTPEIAMGIIQLQPPNPVLGLDGMPAELTRLQASLEHKRDNGCATVNVPAGTYYIDVNSIDVADFSIMAHNPDVQPVFR